MKNLKHKILWMITLLAVIVSCKEDDPELGPPPSASASEFTFEPTAASDNEIVFSANNVEGVKKWDLGNGDQAEGNSASTIYIFKGEYDVTLTVYTNGGSISTTKTVVIEQTDLTKLPVEYTYLTGGVDYPNGKTWVVDASRAGHMGVGPPTSGNPDWWAAKADEKAGGGLYDDKHTFKLDGLEFVQETNGDVFVNTQQAGNFPGSYANVGDFTAPYEAPAGLKWSYSSSAQGKFITISSPGFIGYYTGVSTYEILSISETEMFLRYMDAANAGLGWFVRLIPEGFEPPPPPPPAKSTLPIDFQGAVPPFTGFGGSTYAVVDNPTVGGINTSSKVGQYIKGTEGSWAGIVTDLSSTIDLSANTLFKYKVLSPVTGRALFKLESSTGNPAPVEIFADVTKTNEWEELTFDFSAASTGAYDRIALFLDFDNNNGGTFYIDDIHQAQKPAILDLQALTGSSAKTWKLKPAAGSFGVGPNKGSDEWWPAGQDISGARPCLFNDEFIFKSGDVYEYNANGDIWGEGYMGLSDGCTNESNLPVNAQAWGSGTHTFSFTQATESEPATITVTGTGAFIALPKAKNGAEYSAAPPTTDGSVTYEVLSYAKTASAETLTIAVNIPGGYWTFVLIAE
jgi:hypothetical protein